VDFFLFFSFLLIITCPIFCPSPNLYIPGDFFLAVRVMRVLLTAWFARRDSLVMARVIPLIAGALTATFFNTPR